jgi:hypothetical protein
MNPFRKLIVLAINHFNGTGLAFGLAANINAAAIGSGEWTKLTPYVDGDYWENEKGKWTKYRQVVSKEHGDRLVIAFNALAEKQGENFRGLPIYAGHPDADPQRWPDERRLGGVMGIEARADGIYVKCAWNDLGEKNRAEGYLVYPSPAWPYDLRLKAQTGRIEPLELRSIGMTNTPRIAGVPAWTNSDPSLNQPNQTDIMIKTLLCKILGIAETSTDEEINKAGEAFIAKTSADTATAENALKVEKDKAIAACSERDQAKKDAEKFQKLAVNAKTSAAVTARKITAAEVPAWETKLATNFDEAARELDGKSAVLPNEDLKITQRTGDLSTPAGRKLAFNTAVDAHMAKGLGYDAAINAMRANPEEAALLAAMEPAKS